MPRCRYTGRAKGVLIGFWAFTFLNFASYVVAYLALGGDAMSGRADEGGYFVNNHGRYAEVSQAAWVYSYAHTSLFVLNLFGIAAVHIWLVLAGDVQEK